MKILTWNIERPKAENQLILDKLAEYNAEIVILTETNSIINLGKEYSFVATESLRNGYDGIQYKAGENPLISLLDRIRSCTKNHSIYILGFCEYSEMDRT